MIRLACAIALLWASTATGAQAMPFLAPVFGAIAAFAATPLGGLVVAVGAQLGLGLLKQWIGGDKQQQQEQSSRKQPGFKLTLESGDISPLSFIMGYGATAGSEKYKGVWGTVGDTQNAYLVKVIQLGDLITSGVPGVWGSEQKVTVAWGETPAEQGYPILEFRVGGVDHAWIRTYNGTQSSADSYLVNKFSGHPERPWTSDFVGYGVPYVIITTLFNREVFPNGEISWLFEPGPVLCYDLRKDSTNGGSGSHRWNDQTTWEPTYNPPIAIYNIIRGIYSRTGEWIYGGRNLPAFRLPASSWIAAANECDVPIALAGGGTEPQFRFGIAVDVSVEPLTTIETLLRSCNGRMSEIGGIFEIMVGAPGASVLAFTDADIVISKNQGYNPAPGLQSTYNAIEAKHPLPSERWASKSAPPRYNATWEAQDGGRRLATGLQLNAVPYPIQVQRLMEALIRDERRWRVHSFMLPPSAWVLTGSCVVSWTSVANGYVNKKFLVVRIDGEPGMNQLVILREIDPADYDWSTSLQLPVASGVMTIERPAPQPMYGFAVLPAIRKDNLGRDRSPSIEVQYASGMTDVRSVMVQVKLAGAADDDIFAEGEVPYGDPFYTILPWTFSNSTEYEVRAKFVPFGPRVTEFSSWLSVTTLNVMLIAGVDFDPYDGVVGFDQLGDDLKGYQNWVGANLREMLENAQRLALITADQEFANAIQISEVRHELGVSYGQLNASFEEVITTAIIPLNGRLVALADAITSLSAADGVDVNTARQRMTVVTGPDGYSRIGWETRFDNADPDDWRGAAAYLDTPNDPMLPTRFTVNADQFVFIVGDDVAAPFIVDSGGIRAAFARLGTITSGLLTNSAGTTYLDLDNGNFRVSTA